MKKICYIFFTILFCGVIALGIYSLVKNEQFFQISIADYVNSVCSVISVIFIVYISYYLTEKKTDERIIKEQIKNELDILLTSMYSFDKTYFGEGFVKEKFTLEKKRIDRRVLVLKSYAKRFGYTKETECITENLEALFMLISDNIENPYEIINQINTLNLFKDRIDNAATNIFLALYK